MEEEGVHVAIRLRPVTQSKQHGDDKIRSPIPMVAPSRKQRIRVGAESRDPTRKSQPNKKGSTWIIDPEQATFSLQNHSTRQSQTKYTFDNVYSEDTSTRNLYDKSVSSIVDSSLKGINGTVILYGPSSSGKTFTMQGTSHEHMADPENFEDCGIIHLAARNVFNIIACQPNREFLLRVSYLELCDDQVTDLLVDNTSAPSKLTIRDGMKHKVSVRIDGANEALVSDLESLIHVYHFGECNRSVYETPSNSRSSCAHTIFTITIESRNKTSTDESVEGDENIPMGQCEHENGANKKGLILTSKLTFVDLAASHKKSKTRFHNRPGKSAPKKNTCISIKSFSSVMSRLSRAKTNTIGVDFRSSLLTHVLRPSILKARLVVICCVIPLDQLFEEMRATLHFASRARFKRLKPTSANETNNNKSVMNQIGDEINRFPAGDDVSVLSLQSMRSSQSINSMFSNASTVAGDHIELLKGALLKGGEARVLKPPVHIPSTGPISESQNRPMTSPGGDVPIQWRVVGTCNTEKANNMFSGGGGGAISRLLHDKPPCVRLFDDAGSCANDSITVDTMMHNHNNDYGDNSIRSDMRFSIQHSFSGDQPQDQDPFHRKNNHLQEKNQLLKERNQTLQESYSFYSEEKNVFEQQISKLEKERQINVEKMKDLLTENQVLRNDNARLLEEKNQERKLLLEHNKRLVIEMNNSMRTMVGEIEQLKGQVEIINTDSDMAYFTSQLASSSVKNRSLYKSISKKLRIQKKSVS